MSRRSPSGARRLTAMALAPLTAVAAGSTVSSVVAAPDAAYENAYAVQPVAVRASPTSPAR